MFAVTKARRYLQTYFYWRYEEHGQELLTIAIFIVNKQLLLYNNYHNSFANKKNNNYILSRTNQKLKNYHNLAVNKQLKVYVKNNYHNSFVNMEHFVCPLLKCRHCLSKTHFLHQVPTTEMDTFFYPPSMIVSTKRSFSDPHKL